MANSTLTESILLQWHPGDEEGHQWLVMSNAGVPIQPVLRGSLSALASMAEGRSITLLSPVNEVVLTQVALPPVNKSRALQMLPFAMENQFAAAPSSYHICLLSLNKSSLAEVAYVDKFCVKAWIDHFNEQGLHLACVVPTPLLLPCSENTIHIVLQEEIAWVRTSQYQGFSSAVDHLSTWLRASMQSRASDDVPQVIVHDCRSAGAMSVALEYPVCEVKRYPEGLLPLLATQLKNDRACNLLRGEFTQKCKKNRATVFWCVGLAMVMAVFAVKLSALLVEKHYLTTFNHRVETEIAEIYKQHFPASTAVVAPEFRLQQLLDQQASDNARNDFLSLLASVGEVLSKAGKVSISKIDYKKNSLNLTMTLENFDRLQQLAQPLSQAHLKVTQKSAVDHGAGVKVVLMIQREKS